MKVNLLVYVIKKNLSNLHFDVISMEKCFFKVKTEIKIKINLFLVETILRVFFFFSFVNTCWLGLTFYIFKTLVNWWRFMGNLARYERADGLLGKPQGFDRGSDELTVFCGDLSQSVIFFWFAYNLENRLLLFISYDCFLEFQNAFKTMGNRFKWNKRNFSEFMARIHCCC